MIKKHKNKNNYFLTKSSLWVRDFTSSAHPEDINKLTTSKDYDLILKNEMKNATLNIASIDSEMVYSPNIIIVSDGFEFEKKQHLLKNVKATIIGTNRSLAKWKAGKMDWYLANNPYSSCLSYLPTSHNYYPRCIVSNRTHSEFIVKYRSRLGVINRYTPTKDKNFSSSYFPRPVYHLDDYRNPLCAAISLAYRWQVQKLLLFCCDDVFSDERSGAQKIKDNWMYPQHEIAKDLIDGNLFWLSQIGVKIGNYSAVDYDNATYEEDIINFFGRQ